MIDHFTVIDSIAFFPISFGERFPRFSAETHKFGNVTIKPDFQKSSLFVAIRSQEIISEETFDKSEFLGFAIVQEDFDISSILFLGCPTNNLKRKILDVITKVCFNVHVVLEINLPLFFDECKFFSKYGFVQPQENGNYVVLKYIIREQPHETLQIISKIILGRQQDRNILTLHFPRTIAETLSKYVKFSTEVSGNLNILKYINGNAVLGLNSDYVVGSKFHVQLPQEYSPISFHTHPDLSMKEINAFIAWPSGLDMKFLTAQYLNNKNILVHFVAAPEGIWAIRLSIEFQKLLQKIKSNSFHYSQLFVCKMNVEETVQSIFNKLEASRSIQIDPIDRYKITDWFIQNAKKITIADLIQENQLLNQSCVSPETKKNVLTKNLTEYLFLVDLIKWKQFENVEFIELKYGYAPDDKGGLPNFIPPLGE